MLWARRAEADIEHTNGTFVITNDASTVVLSDTNGSILFAGGPGESNTIFTGGEYGLWSLTNEAGEIISAASFGATSTSNKFAWSLDSSGNVLLLNYSNAQDVIDVTISNRADGVDLSAQVGSRQGTALELDLPGRIRFAATNLSRLVCPLNSSDGVGAAFNASFFQAQPASDPAGWTEVTDGASGYTRLYGGPLLFGTNNNPAPITVTSLGVTWLGTNVATNWNGAGAIVNRAPAPGQSSLALINTTNGQFYSASHLGGAGWLFRFGGEVTTNEAPMVEDVVMATLEHLALSLAQGRTNIGLINLTHGPSIGGWAGVTPGAWSNLLSNESALGQAGLQIVQLPDVATLLSALASTNYLAIINPYGEWTPALTNTTLPATVPAIGTYVKAGGNWFETGGYSFYYALLPSLYYSYDVSYPPAFADFLQIETAGGNAALFGVQPDPNAPWAGSNNPATLFVPGRLAWGGDALGGYCEHAFGTYIRAGQSWQSPTVRLLAGDTAPAALAAYGAANSYDEALSNKMSATVFEQFKNSALVYYSGDCADKIAYLSQLPSPALVHFADYLMGGFDKEYPDDLPPNASFGSPSDFTNFIGQAHKRGLLIMPYSNPTWWCIGPEGPTFLKDGNAPLLRNLDGSLSYEIYGANAGYTLCQWHPDAEAANEFNLGQFTTNYPSDLLFEDQCGARTWQYDLNSASPTPYAFAAGIASRVEQDSATLPISTEDGWDRLVNHASQFCGMAWATVPTTNPPAWQTFLRDRYAPSTWNLFPTAEYIAHDKVSMILHDLGQFVTDDEVMAWNLGLGYGMSYWVNASDLDLPATRQWLLWLDRVQKSVCSQYVGAPISAFTHSWGTNASNPDNGMIEASYGPVAVMANLGPQPMSLGGQTLAPFGFVASASGMSAGNVLMSNGTNGASAQVRYVVETGATNADFWIYTTGEQTATVALPAGFAGAASLQMDGHPTSAIQIGAQKPTLAAGLGMTPTQDRIQPPPALAGKAPHDWPGPAPAIGVLNIPNFPASWTTNTPAQWVQAFQQSPLATEYNLPIQQITSLTELTNALAAGPTAWFALVNPYGEIFPEAAQGQWANMLALIENYVDNGGSWWETAGYSFYNAEWFDVSAWESDAVGPAGLDTFGIPAGTGANNQPAEPLGVTDLGQTFFGPALASQLEGFPAIVNRGLVRDNLDPGHIALLAGAQQDYLGAYRLGGWGYLWRIGGFLPNADVVFLAVPAVMTYLYTNAPLSAPASSVNYLWHGTLSFAGPPTLQAALANNGAVTFQIENCPIGSAVHLERAASLSNPSWQTVLSFMSPPVATNWTDFTMGQPQASYRIRSVPSP